MSAPINHTWISVGCNAADQDPQNERSLMRGASRDDASPWQGAQADSQGGRCSRTHNGHSCGEKGAGMADGSIGVAQVTCRHGRAILGACSGCARCVHGCIGECPVCTGWRPGGDPAFGFSCAGPDPEPIDYAALLAALDEVGVIEWRDEDDSACAHCGGGMRACFYCDSMGRYEVTR